MHDSTVARAPRNTTLAVDGFLARYRGATRALYAGDLRIYQAWCDSHGLDVLEVRRPDLERFREHLEDDRHNAPRSVRRRLQTIRSFYRLAVADELIDRDPTVLLRMPANRVEKTPSWLDRWETQRLLQYAERESPAHHALIAVMVMLGMRVSAVCAIRVEDFAEDRSGYRVLTSIGKGGKRSVKPIPVPLVRIIDAAIAGRTSGPLILRRDGRGQDRNGAYAWVKILCRKAGLPDNIHPHSLRRTAITAIIDNGGTLAQAQTFADHADPRTTQGYYSRGETLDAHAAHIAARLFAA
ncbi:tyrosine-type recombinase/integrase [Microbacterium sp. BG28]|uniref:tyrosine-type recombinase/integrase n=1 Tax=Microbacterium sp. BG28 TaxID=3097356 RepID=UPI002A5A3098|nr:tyrosine-type recombinase/integrase [Microbacterium sp. BG28]MDY0830653.1 tyrosine-type recombinase/integrase [Microbacterium sp. BG28]